MQILWSGIQGSHACFDARPHLNPLPRGEDFLLAHFRFFEGASSDPSCNVRPKERRDWKVPLTRRLESLRYIISRNALVPNTNAIVDAKNIGRIVEIPNHSRDSSTWSHTLPITIHFWLPWEPLDEFSAATIWMVALSISTVCFESINMCPLIHVWSRVLSLNP